MKVRIRKVPTLGKGTKNLVEKKESNEIANTLPPVPRDEANLEAERGETAYVPDIQNLPAHFKVGGKRHSEGGTPLNLPDNSFIFSDTPASKIGQGLTKYFGKPEDSKKKYTPADLAKQYDINKYRKLLDDPTSDTIVKKTAEQMIANYQAKLGKLGLIQEGNKGFPDGIPDIALPYLMSSGISPEEVVPTGYAKDGGNPWQNGASGFGYAAGGPLPKAVAGKETKRSKSSPVGLNVPEGFRALYEMFRKANIDITNPLEGTVQGAKAFKDMISGNSADPYQEYKKTLKSAPKQTTTAPRTQRTGVTAPGQTRPAPSPVKVNYSQQELEDIASGKTPAPAGMDMSIMAWPGDRNDKSNKSAYSTDQWKEFAKAFCPECKTNEELQAKILTEPQFADDVHELHKKYGMPAAGKEVDGKLGHRWDFVFKAKPSGAPATKADNTVAPALKAPKINIGKRGSYAPWWLQDQIKTTGAAGDFFRIKKYPPWEAPLDAKIPEYAFYDPTRELANNTEQMVIGTQGQNAYGNPQTFASDFSKIQGQGAKNAADIMGRYNNLNVGVSNQGADAVANIINQTNQANNAKKQQLYDQMTIANQQFDNAKNMARQNLRQSFIDAITNRWQTQGLNEINPYYHVDPSVGGAVYGTGVPMTGVGGGDGSDFDTRFNHARDFYGMSDADAINFAKAPTWENSEEVKQQRMSYPPNRSRNSGFPVYPVTPYNP